jgi:hypothetical protein
MYRSFLLPRQLPGGFASASMAASLPAFGLRVRCPSAIAAPLLKLQLRGGGCSPAAVGTLFASRSMATAAGGGGGRGSGGSGGGGGKPATPHAGGIPYRAPPTKSGAGAGAAASSGALSAPAAPSGALAHPNVNPLASASTAEARAYYAKLGFDLDEMAAQTAAAQDHAMARRRGLNWRQRIDNAMEDGNAIWKILAVREPAHTRVHAPEQPLNCRRALTRLLMLLLTLVRLSVRSLCRVCWCARLCTANTRARRGATRCL